MIDVIIPVYNIQERGFNRVYLSCYSAKSDVIIVDGSEYCHYIALNERVKKLPNVTHIWFPLKSFNKPKLLNEGIRQSKKEWVMCSDCDYIFKYDLFAVCQKYRHENRMLFKEVLMLPNTNLTVNRVDQWKFPPSKLNEWGKLANGAMQYTTRKWFLENPYNEQMEGWGAMDNMTAYLAVKSGLELFWVKESEILHQWHRVGKFRTKDDKAKFDNNQKILAKFISDNNLKPLL